jgi:hypothetical protein
MGLGFLDEAANHAALIKANGNVDKAAVLLGGGGSGGGGGGGSAESAVRSSGDDDFAVLTETGIAPTPPGVRFIALQHDPGRVNVQGERRN